MNDTIYREEAIEAVGANTWAGSRLSKLPSASPTLYGYRIEILALIATIMQKENVTPDKAIEYFNDIDRMYRIIIQEEKELLNRALRWSEGQEA